MFSQDIVDSDAFLDMPMSCQLLYYHLGMRADDDGFVNPKKIMRMIGASDDDLKVLVSKRFALMFESGVIVIKHWLIHNVIRKDRYFPTQYQDEKNLLIIKGNKSYTERLPSHGGRIAAEVHTEDRIRQDKTGKNIPETSSEISTSEEKPIKEWKYENTLEDMKKNKDSVKRVLAYFWELKGFAFENSKQVSLRFGRDYKAGKKLVDSGYSDTQIENSFNYVFKKYQDIDWTLETVTKVIAEANK